MSSAQVATLQSNAPLLSSALIMRELAGTLAAALLVICAADAAVARPQASARHLDTQFWLQFAQQQAEQAGVSFSNACSARFGADFLNKWRKDVLSVCSSPSASGSTVTCHAHPTGAGLACRTIDMVVNAAAFMGQRSTGATTHTHFLPAGADSSVMLGCNMSAEAASAGHMSAEHLPWFKGAYAGTDDITARCQGIAVVDHPVLFVSRLDMTNVYHHLGGLCLSHAPCTE